VLNLALHARLRNLARKGAIPAWCVLGFSLVLLFLDIAGYISTTQWLYRLLPDSWREFPSMSMQLVAGLVGNVPLWMFVAALIWLGILAFAPSKKRTAISAKLIRAHLVRHDPFAELTDDLYHAASGSDGNVAEYDFLFEVFLVNKTDKPITVQKIVAEAKIGDNFVPLSLNEELADYQIRFKDKLIDNPSWIGGKHPKDEDLAPSLVDDLKTSTLVWGIKHQGWVRFSAKINPHYLKGVASVPYRINLIDALDGVHPILTDGPLSTDGEIIHNTKVWQDRLRSH
jgi:hypothetical protein